MSKQLSLNESLDCCPVCAGKNFTLRYSPDICQCHDCEVYFRNPRPDQKQILDSYNEGETFRQWQGELDIRSRLWKKRCSLIRSYRSSGTLLDIGTGDGYFLYFAKNIFSVEATEISKRGADYAGARGHNVHLGTVFDADFDGRKFDVITLWHVLEHLPAPGQVLNKVKSLLKPDGLLVIAVPNETRPLWSARISRRRIRPFGRLSRQQEIHLVHFTPASLKRLLEQRFGFNVLNLDVDDVHVYRRRLKLPGYYLNKLCSRIFNWHWDTAMVVVCTPAIDPEKLQTVS